MVPLWSIRMARLIKTKSTSPRLRVRLKVEVLATPAVDAAPADKSQDLWFGNTLLSKIDGVKFENVEAARTPTVSQPSIRAMCFWPA